jgi:hypothetical protein
MISKRTKRVRYEGGMAIMRWWFVIGAVLLLAVVGAGIAYGIVDGDHREVERVVTTTDGETLVVRDDDGPRFFPFGFLVIPLFWFLVIGLLFAAFGRRRRGGPGPWAQGPSPGGTAPGWFDEWHRRAHEGNASPPPGASGPTGSAA